MVEDGDSAQASFSADGHRLVYVSGQRTLHKLPQVYVKDLRVGQERRITFQAGTLTHPRFHPRGDQIIYSSTTDEDTEYPAFLRDGGAASKLPAWLRQPAEIYLHGLNTFDIERLNTHAGFDGEARFIRGGRSITWTQVTRDRSAIQQNNRATHQTVTVKNLGNNPVDYVLANDLVTAAWLSFDDSFATSHLMIRRAGKVTEVGAERSTQKMDLNFSEDSRWLLWAELDPVTQGYSLFGLDVATGCARELKFASPGRRRDPALSPDRLGLVYTWLGPDKARVMRTKFDPGTCP